jgi:hypothetical protein
MIQHSSDEKANWLQAFCNMLISAGRFVIHQLDPLQQSDAGTHQQERLQETDLRTAKDAEKTGCQLLLKLPCAPSDDADSDDDGT